jgi:GTP-binding protein HflX
MEGNLVEKKNAILLAVNLSTEEISKTLDHINELEFLADTLDIKTKNKFIQKLICANSKTYFGSGKILEIKDYIKENEINLAIIDDQLSPSQFRNLEKEFEIEILDRTCLIFKIFAKRAKTNQAKIQVELAQYEYLLPRLKRMWTHLSRQQGGGANMRGPGEKELETDKRIAREKISNLKEKLKKIENQSKVQKKNRDSMVKIALVGYTNVGKSTFMNLVTNSNLFAENKLFATLDSTVRKSYSKDIPFVLIDTVGFIRKLPTNLIESFKSTLSSIKDADILFHIIDISSPCMQDQIETVEKTLKDINAFDIETIKIFNKADLIDLSDEKFKNLKDSIVISSKDKSQVEKFFEKIHERISYHYNKKYPNYLES